MEAGKLDRRITLETTTVGRDEYGGTADTWGNPEQVWANVRPKTAREVFQGDQLTAVEAVVFTIRYREGITAGNTRIVHKGKNYNVKGVIEPDRNKTLQLIAEADDNG